MLLLKQQVASALTHANTIMFLPSVSHLMLDLFLHAAAAEMWDTTLFTLIASSGLNVGYLYMYQVRVFH